MRRVHQMNTSSVRLSAFDIVVTQLEEAMGQSLHDLVDNLGPKSLHCTVTRTQGILP